MPVEVESELRIMFGTVVLGSSLEIACIHK